MRAAWARLPRGIIEKEENPRPLFLCFHTLSCFPVKVPPLSAHDKMSCNGVVKFMDDVRGNYCRFEPRQQIPRTAEYFFSPKGRESCLKDLDRDSLHPNSSVLFPARTLTPDSIIICLDLI